MRWDEQRVEKEDEGRLFGLAEEAVVRTFDAPEAMGIRFHEVRAKSALNRVPGGRYGFNWTINSYRGCTHACAYCLAGDTKILMGDGRTMPLAEVRVGDEIYGTERRGSYRRYAKTRVLAHWTTRKEAYRIELEDGTELIASGDHRFLTNRGWKYVIGAEQGRRSRPHLTTNNKLMGVGDRDLIRWPDSSSDEWTRGFLAGIFDAEGSRDCVLRICNKNEEIIARISDSLRQFGFAHTVEAPRASGVRNVRLLGGLPEQLRFLQRIDPAVARKRSLTGIALKSQARLKVVAIEPLGRRIRMFDITTGTGDFIANGVVSHNCFARRTHTYLDMDAGRDFEREIVVKVNVPELVRAELARPSWKRELVALGTNTDPYQWVESRYRMMPEILAALEEAETPVSVLTKSPLLLRDIEIYERMAKKLPVSVNLSIPTLDEKVWRQTEPHTPSPAARLDAVAELRRRGIDSGVLVAPLMPGINDRPDQVQPIVDRAREAGATFLGGVALHLRDEVKEVFFAWLETKRPDLIPRYEQLYANNRAYLPAKERGQVTKVVRGWGRSGAARRRASSAKTPAGGVDLGDHPEEQLHRRGGGAKSATGPAGPEPAATGPAGQAVGAQERLF